MPLGDPLFTGVIQEASYDPVGGGRFQVHGWSVTSENFIQTFQPMCRTDLFSSLCRVDPNAFDHAGTVSSIIDRFTITVGGLASPPDDGWFNGGVGVTAAGFRFEIASWIKGSRRLTTYLPVTDVGFSVGLGLTLWPGCDKTIATCKGKFNNALNHQGEPHFLGAAVAGATAT